MHAHAAAESGSSSAPNPKPNPTLTDGQRHTQKASRVRLKNGFYSERAVIGGESEEAFEKFREDMILSLLPGTPIESALVDQMVMAQWKLLRTWAAQSGVHLRLSKAHPPGEDVSYPEQVAECIHQDNADTGDLHRMSLEELRLVNIFHKAARKFELLTEQRTKRLMQREQRNQIETEEYYLGREGYLKFGIRPPKLDAHGRRNPDWTDPYAKVDVPVEVPELAASGSRDGRSPENEDRREPHLSPALTGPPSPGGGEGRGERCEASSAEPPSDATSSTETASGKFTEQTPPKAPRPRQGGRRAALAPNHLTPYQQYWESLQAADDAFGDRLEGKVAADD